MTYEEYKRELILMKQQYGQEEELYPLINMILRECDNTKKLSIRDVHNARQIGNERDVLLGCGNGTVFPDIAIFDAKFNQKDKNKINDDNERLYIYGCVEAKKYGKNLIPFIEFEKNELLNYRLQITIQKAMTENKKSCVKDLELNEENAGKWTWIKNINKWITPSQDFNDDFVWQDCQNYQGRKLCDLPKYKKIYKLICVEDKKEENKKEKNKEIVDGDLVELLSEILWYKKVIYTNGLVWKYLELIDPEEKDKKSEYDRKDLYAKDYLTNGMEISINCKTICNLDAAFLSNLEKKDLWNSDLEKIINEKNEKEWARLKYNLSMINWIGNKKINETEKKEINETEKKKINETGNTNFADFI